MRRWATEIKLELSWFYGDLCTRVEAEEGNGDDVRLRRDSVTGMGGSATVRNSVRGRERGTRERERENRARGCLSMLKMQACESKVVIEANRERDFGATVVRRALSELAFSLLDLTSRDQQPWTRNVNHNHEPRTCN